VHVLDDPFVNSSFAPEVYAPPPAGLRESWIKGAESLLSTQLTPEEVAEFRSTYAVLFGAPAKTVVDFATSHGMDLIVMGTHGRGGVAHLLMGSVAERVVRTAHCPVLTVRDETTSHRAEKPAFASTVV
jgi:nucleotide-binding universal stress UspA family protein